MNEMMKNAAMNLAKTAGHCNDAKRSGNLESERLWNKIYMEKAALLKEMGFEVMPETDKDGYAVAVTVGGAVGAAWAEVHSLFQ